MKKIALALIGLGLLTASAFGQATRSRPRIAATPTPPVIQGGDRQPERTGQGAPPVFRGNNTPGTATPQPTPPVTGNGTGDGEVIKVETNLVTMPVSVLDREGRFISGLRQQDFRIFENGIEQQIEYFQSVEQPFTVVLLIDVSPSTQWQIEEIHTAAIAFIDQLRANDRVMVIAFDDSFQVLSPATNNRAVLRSAIRNAQFGDGTSLYEAVDKTINQQLRHIEGRKAVVLFTDGVDTTSRRANFQSTIREVEEADALFYPIRYDTERDMSGIGGGGGGVYYPGPRRRGGRIMGWPDVLGGILGGGSWPIPGSGRSGRSGGGGSREEYETGRRYLETIAANSGGRKFEADSLQNLDAAFSGIAEELRRQYSVGYYPDVIGQVGERRQIRIRVMRPDVVVRAKTSYIVGNTNRTLADN